jgi:O-antigen/teichoic acid export membrane protein
MTLLRVRFVRDVAFTGGAQALQAVLAMLTGIIVARYFGAQARGILSVLVALGTMTVLVGSLGIPSSSVYFFGRFKSSRDTVVANSLVMAITGGVVSGAALLVLGLLLHRQLLGAIPARFFLLFLAGVPFMYFNAFGQRILLGAGRIRTSNVPYAVQGVGLIAGTGVAILLTGRRLAPLIGLRVMIEVVTTLFLLLAIRRLARPRLRLARPLFRQQLGYSMRNYASSLLWLFLLQSDLVLCNYFIGSARTGVYSVAVSLGLPVTMLANVVGTLTFQRVSSEDARERRIANTNRSMRLLAPITALAMVALGTAAGTIIPVIYGREFTDASTAFVLLLPGLFAFCIEIVLINFLAGEGSPPIVYRAPFVGLAVNVLANIWVIPRWGIDGAAVTSSVGYSIVLALVLRHYLRATHSRLSDVAFATTEDVRALVGQPQPDDLETRGEVAPAHMLSIHRVGGGR